ncbi:MAG: HlyD family type I secretion periplasmic adaptor subunit [Novosphingobium sp.]
MQALRIEDLSGPIKVQDDPAPEKRMSLLFGGAFFIGFLGWAAFTPLDAGAYAQGQIAVAGNRQAVQHREGGIVTSLLVREGSQVKQGQPLLTISADNLQSSERALTNEYLMLLAERSRLVAEASGAGQLAVPPEFAGLPPEDAALAKEALRTQTAMLQTQRSTLQAQKSVLGRQTSEISARIGGLAAQSSSLVRQRESLESQLEGLKELHKRGFASTNRIRELERVIAATDGDSGQRAADIAAARESIGQNRMQALVLTGDRMQQAGLQLRDVLHQIDEIQPRLATVREQLRRSVVRAPASGKVVGLSVFTIGAVVGPGQTLMEVVPQDRELIIKAKLTAETAQDLHPGSEIRVRFPTIHDRSRPEANGTITTISADALTDERTGIQYYSAEARVPRTEIEKVVSGAAGKARIQAGMPVEMLATLQRRTMLDYLLEPIFNALWYTGREY